MRASRILAGANRPKSRFGANSSHDEDRGRLTARAARDAIGGERFVSRARVAREGVDEIAAADCILLNGRILTLDPRRPVVSALAIVGGRIAATGSPASVRGFRGRRTRVVDLNGATVVPGLVDAHAHLDREGLKLIYPSLARCRSIADIQAVIRRLAARRPRGEWIVSLPVGAP